MRRCRLPFFGAPRAVEQRGPAPLGRRLVRVGILVGFSLRRWNGRERGLPFQRRGRNPATPPPPQNAASNLCLYEAVFSHCQTFSLQQDAAG